MQPTERGIFLSIALFLAVLAALEIGYRIGDASTKHNPELAHQGIGVIEAAVFALLGLLLAFSFSAGLSRLEIRRHQIVEEANAIGTAYLRVDLLPGDVQTGMRQLFRDYLDTRLNLYQHLGDHRATAQSIARAAQLQREIWSGAVRVRETDAGQNIGRLLLPAINRMIDISTARLIAMRTHLPPLILALLLSVAGLSGLLAGYAVAKRRSRSWLHMVLYAAVVAVTLYAVLDLDYPRNGFIRLDDADQALRDVRQAMR